MPELHSFASASDLTSARAMAAIAVILLAGALLAAVARRLGQPPVIGEVAAGIVLGPSLLGLLPGHLTAHLFPAEIKPMLTAVSQLGLIVFLFLIGWEFNKRLISGRRTAAGVISVSSVVVAFALGAGLALVLYSDHDLLDGKTIDRTGFVVFIGAAMAITAFPVLARILEDSGLMHTRIGALALAGAAIDDVIAWCLLAFASATVTAKGQGDLVTILVLSAVYVAVMFVLVRPLLAALVQWLGRAGGPVVLLPVLVTGALLSSFATTWIGIHAIFGAFFFGFVMPREVTDAEGHPVAPLASLRSGLEGACAVLLPVFFIITGLAVDIGGLTARNWVELVAILAVACAGKFIGAGGAARAVGFSWRETGVIGVLMNTRGLTELIILNAGVQLGVLDTQMFTMMVIMALFTTALAGPLLPLLLERPLHDRPVVPEEQVQPARS